jgi:hypothetical protein
MVGLTTCWLPVSYFDGLLAEQTEEPLPRRRVALEELLLKSRSVTLTVYVRTQRLGCSVGSALSLVNDPYFDTAPQRTSLAACRGTWAWNEHLAAFNAPARLKLLVISSDCCPTRPPTSATHCAGQRRRRR